MAGQPGSHPHHLRLKILGHIFAQCFSRLSGKLFIVGFLQTCTGAFFLLSAFCNTSQAEAGHVLSGPFCKNTRCWRSIAFYVKIPGKLCVNMYFRTWYCVVLSAVRA